MTDKVQKIREEVVRLHNLLPVMDGDNISVNYADRICTALKMYIDSLKEEPVSDDLEKAAINYMKSQNPPIWGLHDGFIAGAKLKEEQFEKNRLEHCNSITNEQAELEQGFIDQHLDKYQRMPTFLDAIEYGMRLQKEKMMKNAVECEYFDGSLFCNDLREKYRDGDKVKIVIVKNE